MDLSHRFTVATPVEETWAHFQDIAALAECFPGAQLTSADADTFAGTVKVKLGPIALVYAGSGTFVDKDDAAHSFKVDAKGKDKRGNGTAGAQVSLSMHDGADGGTDVEVLTDLNITGKPAQFGRGVMQDVSDKLLGQFVSCLEQRLTGADAEPAPAPAPVAATEVEPTPLADAAATAAAATPRPTPRPLAAAPAQDDALDLGAAVLPVLAKAYWRQGLGALAVLLVIWRILRR
ncbi:SRPBCC family protein [Nocardioides rubriscoriae]|uniref:SRPBCC family protein n=1 Tax=Nocardioides rubriscoriae TaxID=642762 RepID=UPI0011DF0B8D|nr:SRPBCC family protein [Nocardioides rubriscoriae]